MHISIIKALPLVFFALFIIGISSCTDEETKIQEEGLQYLQDYISPTHKWGLLNLQNEVVYEPRLDEIRPFHDGAAAINVRGQWGFIDTSLQVFIKPSYRSAWNFYNGYARVQLPDGSYNFINKQNDLLSDVNFLYTHDFRAGFATAKIGIDSFIILDTMGNVSSVIKAKDLLPADYGYIIASQSQAETIYSHKGKPYRQLSYDRITVIDSTHFRVRKDMFYGVVDIDGATIIPIQYRKLRHDSSKWIIGINEGGVKVYRNYKQVKTLQDIRDLRYAGYHRFIYYAQRKWGIMDTAFHKITPPKYDQLYNFNQGIAPFRKGELWAYVNVNGIELSKPQYGLAWPFHEAYARVMYYEGMAIIDKFQNIKIPPAHRTYRDLSASYIPFKGR